VNVLSLFDGMSCGQIALERVGIKVDNYYASEIDKYAIEVTQKNYPNTKQIGSVEFVTKDTFGGVDIDLVIGGSPCQGFSFAGKQLNFNDSRSRLFFEYARIVNELKPKYFLLENVRMKKEFQDIISQYLGVEPITINSNLVSGQNRIRLYWTNIKGVTQPTNKNINHKDIMLVDVNGLFHTDKAIDYMNRDFCGKKRCDGGQGVSHEAKQKSSTVTANWYKGIPYNYLILQDGRTRKYHPIECERLQTVPDNYTDGVSNTQRYKMLGNGWTVDVVAHIFQGLKA